MAKYHKPLTPKQISEIKDKDIDFSDIPELDELFWEEAEIFPETVGEAKASYRGSQTNAL